MRFSLQREVLLKPLAQVVNVVERRQTLPVLANLLAKVEDDRLSLTGTDLEVEMVARTAVEDAQPGESTIPARKLFEIVRHPVLIDNYVAMHGRRTFTGTRKVLASLVAGTQAT